MEEHLWFNKFRKKKKLFVERIIEWYKKKGRHNLPWRLTRDPWKVLVAAFLLRKTTKEQVIKVYSEFIKRFPTVRDVFESSEEEIKELIRPLGIEHHRARLLKQLAEVIITKFHGKIPGEKDKLKQLPGVGDYIASEVLCVAYNKPEPLLDRNMIRVIERVFAVKSAKRRPHTDKNLWAFAKMLIPQDPSLAKEFNYGILDFASAICTVRRPKCTLCPLNDICYYRASREKQ